VNLTKPEIVNLIKKEKLLITILFIVSVISGSVLIFLFDNILYFSIGFFCYFLAILCLPKINRAKQDIKDVGNLAFKEFNGKVEDIFPENESKEFCKWIIIIRDDETGKLYEYLLNKKTNLEAGLKVRIKITKNTKIPVQIEET